MVQYLNRYPMLKFLINGILVFTTLVFLIGLLVYFVQERLIFFPNKLPRDHQFSFGGSFEEVPVVTPDHTSLHAVLFKAGSNSKGVIFYLHGNAGAVDSWGELAGFYNELGYDVFMPDYRGYGKSEGVIKSEKQFFEDAQAAYAVLKTRYSEDKIIILGYSIGTGTAAYLASTNRPRLLILQAPYYTLGDLVKKLYPFLPSFLLKYKFRTAEYLKQTKAPVIIFHGDRDEVIYYGSSIKLKTHLKATDSLVTLKNQSHNGITENRDYQLHMKRI